MGEAARNIHPDIGRSVSKEEAKAHLKKCRDLGLVHLVGKGKIDAMWLNAYPTNKLMTVCNCCPCCCISVSFPYLADNLRRLMSRLPGVSVHINEDQCIACGKCVENCIYKGVTINNDKAEIIDSYCIGCGRCVDICPSNAITLAVENNEYVETAIERLTSIVDVG